MGFRSIQTIIIFQFSGSFSATYNIIINHTFEGVHISKESYNMSFSRRQVLSSCNHTTGSILATYLTGGLNHQIEHHLFPALPIHHLPLISGDIQRICNKYKIKYNTKDIFSLIYSSHKTLQLYGNCEIDANLPSLGDYNSFMEG